MSPVESARIIPGGDEPTERRKTVFDRDPAQTRALLLSHGVRPDVCEMLRSRGVDGQTLLSWTEPNGRDDMSDLARDLELSDLEARHILAIAERYKRNPCPLKEKLLSDCVHGHIELHPLVVVAIDTPQVQRLRHLKQLGSLNYVYPCAVHTRFEHSIGTSHLAGVFVRHLRQLQPELQISHSDELCLRIAGLCHDLGHGPFSHLFEQVLESLGVHDWRHELASVELFEKMLRDDDELRLEFEAFGLFESDREFIKDLIYNEKLKKSANVAEYEKTLRSLESLKSRGLAKSFLFEIVSNNRSGIDVDKFDYFERDAVQLGFKNSFDYKRFIKSTRVIAMPGQLSQICVRDKEISNLYEMFHVRETLTRRAYKHETGTAIDFMITEALLNANSVFGFDDMIRSRDYDQYERLNDSVVLQILASKDPGLLDSRRSLERIERRKLFKYVGHTVLPSDFTKAACKEVEKEFLDYVRKISPQKANSLIIQVAKINYGSSKDNPIENVRFFAKHDRETSRQISKEQVSGMLLDVFEDMIFRVFSKDADADVIDETSRLFSKWCAARGFPKPMHRNCFFD